MRSVYDNIVFKKAIAASAVTGAAGSPATAQVFVVDTYGYNTGAFEVMCGTPTGTTVTFTVSASVTECATSDGSYTAVSGATGTVTGFGTALAEHCQIRVEGLGTSRQRYLKLSVVATTAPTDKTIPVFAVCALGRGYKAPGSNAATGTAAA